MKSVLQRKIVEAQKILNQKNSNPNRAIKLLDPFIQDELTPWQAYHLYGLAMLKKRDFSGAMDYLKRALYSGSEEFGTFHGLSVAAYHLKKYQEAEEYAEKAIQIKCNQYDVWMILGDARRELGKLNEALLTFQKCNQINPKSTEVAVKIAQIYKDQGFAGKALEMYDIAIQMNRSHLGAINEKSKILTAQKKYDEALETIESGLNIEPDNIVLQATCADLKKEMGEYTRALTIYEGILKKHPEYGGIRVNYANILQDLGRFDEAEENYLQANKDFPALMESYSNYLFVQHYNPKKTKEEIFEAHKKWDSIYAPQNPQRPIPENIEKERKLRVGLISGGFRKHPVGWMITPGLEKLDRNDFDLFFYSNFNQVDEITKRLHDISTGWHMISGIDDDQLNLLIREDKIDILIDLSGHASETRLRAVAMEPAPVIVKWVGGLINTTGLKAIDFLISDSIETPAGSEPFYLEKLIRMPDDYICFNAPEYAPEVSESPFRTNGVITFGCFNNPVKVNKEILKYWAAIMIRIPGSRLFLKSKQYGNKMYVERIQTMMNEYGIDSERLLFEGLSPHAELLQTYHRIDIALDPWPYSGGLTTCEALWMGVPVITRPGETFAGRHSASHLHHAGFPEWIAGSWEEYIQKVVDLAGDEEKLSRIRAGLRDKVAASPLCDSDRYGAHLGQALRAMWHQRVEGYEKGLSSTQWQNHIEVFPVQDHGLPANKKRQQKGERDSKWTETARADDEKTGSGTLRNPGNGHPVDKIEGEIPAEGDTRYLIDEDCVIYTPPPGRSITSYRLAEQGNMRNGEIDFIQEYLRPGMLSFDVGAEVGVYTMAAAKKGQAHGKVVSFEPHPVLNRYLEKNIEENGFTNVEIVDLAVSDEVARKRFMVSDEMCECGKLDPSGALEVKTTTLDAWWRLNGNPEIQFIRIDVNGDELDVLKGARHLLGQTAPLLQIAVSNLGGRRDEIFNCLRSIGYHPFRYLPELKLLVKIEGDEDLQERLAAIAAVRADQVEALIEQGIIFDDSAAIGEPADNAWIEGFETFQWGREKMSHWKEALNQIESENYKKAINHIASAYVVKQTADPKTRSLQVGHLLSAAQLLIALYHQGMEQNLPISLSLSRVLNDLGRKGEAAAVLKNVLDRHQTNGHASNGVQLPFYMPLHSQDSSEIKTDFNRWLTVRLAEAWLLLKDQSSYDSGERELKMLHLLEDNPEVGEEISRRIKTSRHVRGSEGRNGQNGAVQVKNQKREDLLEFSASSELQKAVTDFHSLLNGRKVVFIPNGHGGNYGVIQELQNQMYRHFRHLGIHAEWAVQNPSVNPDVKEVSEYVLRNRGNTIYFTGIYWYDLSVKLKTGGSENLFDHFDLPVISLIGDHPYTSFMHSRVSGCSQSGLMLSNWESLADEFRFLKPGRNHVKSLNTSGGAIDTIGPDWNHNRHYNPHQNRELDLLIPLGLVKFAAEKENQLLQQAKSWGRGYHTFVKTVLGESLTEYGQSILDIAKKAHHDCFGSDWEIQNEWDEHTTKLTGMIGEIDWVVRQKRRREMLTLLLKSKVIRDMKVGITLPEEYRSILPDEMNHPDLKFLGIVPARKLEEYYGNSRFVLHSNLTFTDAVHERVRMASAMGAAIITDPSPGLHLFNREQNSLIFRSFGESYEKFDFSAEASEQMGRRGYKVAKDKADADRYLTILFERWSEYLRER